MKNDVLLIAAVLLAVLNLFSFGLMAYDKRCAGQGKWRVPEKRLFLAAGCFGALGGVMGMVLCRHKTKHASFRILFPLMLILQCAALAAGWFFLLR